MSPRVVAGIQARLSSSRLPGKVLADVAGKPLIQRIYQRVCQADLVDEVFVLTSEAESDNRLVEILTRLKIPFRRGPLDDVLARYAALADEFEPQQLVRVTGDAPFVEPDFIDLQLGALRAFDADFVLVVGNEDGSFEGTLGGAAALSTRALRRALSSQDRRDREHVGSFYFRSHQDEFRNVELEVDEVYKRPGLRLCVDEDPDLELARRVYEQFGHRPFTTAEVIDFLDRRPDVRALNQHIVESEDNQALRRVTRETAARTVGRWR